MKYIGRSKISKFSSKPNIFYPQIRMPQQCADIIGETAHIYETQLEDQKVFVIAVGDENPEHIDMQRNSEVLQLNSKVVKLGSRNDVESRLSALESRIYELEKPRFQNNGSIRYKTK